MASTLLRRLAARTIVLLACAAAAAALAHGLQPLALAPALLGALLAAAVLGVAGALRRLWPSAAGAPAVGPRGAWLPWQPQRTLPVAAAAQELRDASPYLELLRRQLDGAIRDSERSALQMIERLNHIHATSRVQFDHIQVTESDAARLMQVVKDKMMADTQLRSILQMFVEKQEQDEAANVERIRRLQGVKELQSLVDVIATVARQTNFLAINAAIEAARAGESGRGFAVVAGEIRQLSNRTAEVAVDIAAKIHKATDGIDAELAATAGENGRATGNMRRVLGDVAQMQERFAESIAQVRIDQVVAQVKAGHEAIVDDLGDSLAEVQGQDVMRQRVEHVGQALAELDAHLQSLARQVHEGPWDPDGLGTLQERLRAQQQAYVMHSQRRTHETVTGAPAAAREEEPRIELF